MERNKIFARPVVPESSKILEGSDPLIVSNPVRESPL